MITRARSLTDRDYTAWGDSQTEASSGGIVEGQRWPARLGSMFSPPRLIQNRGVGGETSTQILARVVAVPSTPAMGQIFWMGRNDPSNAINQATTLSNIAAAVSWCGHQRYLILGVLPKTDGTEDAGAPARTAIDALNAALLAAYPTRFVSLAGMQDNAALRSDGLHLNAAGQTELREDFLYPAILALEAS